MATGRVVFGSLYLAIGILPLHALAASLLVSIEGLDGPELTNVQNSLSIYQLLDEQSLLDKVRGSKPTELKPSMSERRLKRIHAAAELEIQTALQPFGYYAPTIDATLNNEQGVWQASYVVETGEPVSVSEVLISVLSDDEQLKNALENPGRETQNSRLQVDERLLHQKYEQTKAQLLNAAIDAGYLDARFTINTLKVDPRRLSASVTLELNTGERYRFGDITFQQSILQQELIEQYIPFDKGDVFDTNQLITLQLALNDSGYFNRVEVTADRESATDKTIPVTVIAEPSRPRQYTLGFGYGTDTQLRTKLGIEFRRINQRGHKVHTDFLLSGVKRSAAAQYEIPLGDLGANSLRFIFRYEQADVGDGDGETERYVLGVNHNDTWRGWQRRLYLNFLRENFRFGTGTDREQVNLLTPGINLVYTKADNLLLPQQGYSWFIDVHAGDDAVISDTTFLQGRVVGQRVWSPSDRMRVLLRAEYGITDVDNFELLPPNERFFAGGDRSVRGYAYQSLGPADTEESVVGGSHLATGSVEMDYLVYNDIGGALFFDVGDAAMSNDFDFNRSAGVGLRWRSPVGMFRLDAATPLDSDDNIRLHISIGSDL